MAKAAARSIPRPFTLPWGSGHIVPACRQAGSRPTYTGEHHQPTLQLLEFEDGSLEVRFCYYDHEGPFDYAQDRRFQRSPLIVGNDEIAGLRRALAQTPRLRSLLREVVG